MTNCIAPGEIQDWDLEAYMHGDGTTRVAEHIARCPSCQAKADELRDLGRDLASALFRADCPSMHELLLYRWGQLPATQARQIRSHLSRCAACHAEQDALTGPEPSRGEQMLAGFRRQLTVLTSVLQAPLAPAPALRGAGNAPAVYAVPGTDLEIVLTQDSGSRGYVLTGQVLGASPEDLLEARAGVLAEDRLLLETVIDPTGWFTLQPLQAGAHTIWIDCAEMHIRTPDVMIGPPKT